jgi:AraC family transcriptional regulator
MENQDIRIISLPAMHVASFYAFSSSPELEAWEKAVAWAKANGKWQEAPTTRIFGFNNPDPSAGSPNYGYVQSDAEPKIKDFSGGLYAVLHCDVNANHLDVIGSAWGRLVKWLEASHYKHGNHQWLEEHLTRHDSNDKGFILDLYLPISE